MNARVWLGAALLAMAGVVADGGPAAAQFSKSYKFLDAVRKADGQEVTDDLAQPGSTIVNTHDLSTGETALHIVTQRRDLAWMEFLLAKGADPDARDAHGTTALVLATNLGFDEGVQLLVEHGAKVDEPNDTGETPLIAAVHRHNLAMVRDLLKGGANPDRNDNTGRSARDYALQAGKDSPLVAAIEESAKTRKAHGPAYGPAL